MTISAIITRRINRGKLFQKKYTILALTVLGRREYVSMMLFSLVVCSGGRLQTFKRLSEKKFHYGAYFLGWDSAGVPG